MPVRFITKDEVLSFRKITGVAFVESLDVDECKKELAAKPTPEKGHIAYYTDAGDMTACMILTDYDMWLDDNLVKMVGIGAVASLPEFRHERAVRKCFEFTFKRLYETGVAFSALYPFSHPFYRKFGYELVTPEYEYTVPTEALLAKYRHTGWARMYEKPAPLGEYRKIYEATYSRYNGAVKRTDDMWLQARITQDPYKERLYTYLLGDENGANAYLTFKAEKSGDFEFTANVLEISYLTTDALCACLGFLGRLTAQYGKAKLVLPSDVPIRHLIDEPYDIDMHAKNQTMFRVVNVPLALKAMRHPDGANYTLRVHDDGIPENDGAYRVSCADGGVSVEKCDLQACDLELDVRTLAPLIMGGLTLRQAAYRQDVKINGNAPLLNTVFVSKPCHLTEGF